MGADVVRTSRPVEFQFHLGRGVVLMRMPVFGTIILSFKLNNVEWSDVDPSTNTLATFGVPPR